VICTTLGMGFIANRVALLGLAAAALAMAAPGCASEAVDSTNDFSESTWSALSTDDSVPAVLDNATAVEDKTDPPEDLDATDDVAESAADDVDEEKEAADGSGQTSTASADADVDLAPLGAKNAAGTFQNAVLGNCADPGVIHDGVRFIAACTGGGYPTFTSPDLVHWTASGHIFGAANRPKWASKNFWAPEIHHIGAGFVAYFAAFSPAHGEMCIGAARGPSATGPWTDLGRPLVCDKGVGLIDVNAYTDGKGRHFLYYKTEGNALRPQQKTIIYGQQLGADGVSFVGHRHRLLKNTLGWEGDVVEAPFVVGRGKYYFMFYSGFRYCNGTYGVGVARARSPLGPFRKKGAPILSSNAGWAGPGHNSVVRTGGHDWIVYHAWKGAHQCSDGGNREMLIDRIEWAKGWPSINNGTPSRGRHTAPALD
jgi:arabinan endo-1,5-alpha-L-arabinosidase